MFIISFEDGRPTEPHTDLAAALDYARDHHNGQAWLIGETRPDGPPRTVASIIPANQRSSHLDTGAIAQLVEIGREDLARDLLGDEHVDDWFRRGGWDVNAAR